MPETTMEKHLCTGGGTTEKIKALSSAGADLNAKNKFGHTPLHQTWMRELAKALLEEGADPNIRDNNGKTPVDVNPYYVREAQALLEMERKTSPDDTYSCQYTSDLSKIKSNRCGQSSLCMAEVSCNINVDDYRMIELIKLLVRLLLMEIVPQRTTVFWIAQ